MERIGARATQEKSIQVASVTSMLSFVNTAVIATDEGAMREVSRLETVVTAVDPTTGLAHEFANALKLCRGVPGTAFIPESRPLLNTGPHLTGLRCLPHGLSS